MITWKDLTKFERFALRMKEYEMFFLWGGITSSAFVLTLSVAQIFFGESFGVSAIIPAALWLFFIILCLVSSPYGDRVKRKIHGEPFPNSYQNKFISFVDEEQNLKDYSSTISVFDSYKADCVHIEIFFQVHKVTSTLLVFSFSLPDDYFDIETIPYYNVKSNELVLNKIYDAVLMESL